MNEKKLRFVSFVAGSRRSPLDDPAVASWVEALLRDVVLPAGWVLASAARPSLRDGEGPLHEDDDAARALGATSVWDLDPADGLSTTSNDDSETAALRAAFGRMITGRGTQPKNSRLLPGPICT